MGTSNSTMKAGEEAVQMVKSEARRFEARHDEPDCEETLEVDVGGNEAEMQERVAEKRMATALAGCTAVVGVQGMGKSVTVVYTSASSLVSPATYAEMHRGQPVDVTMLEGSTLHEKLGNRGGVDAGVRLLHPPHSYSFPSDELQDRYRKVSRSLDRCSKYKLTDSYKYLNPGLFYPPIDWGRVGSTCLVVMSHSNEVHSLYRFYPVKTFQNWIKSHLDFQAGETMESEQDVLFFEEVWRLFTPKDADLASEVQRYTANRAAYVPRLKPWVEKAAGRALIVRTQRGDQLSGQRPPADLHRDLTFQQDVNSLMMAPGQLGVGTRSSLLQAFAEQDPEGPWEAIAAALEDPVEREQVQSGLHAMLELVGVYAPGIPFRTIDTLGVNDLNSVRRMRMRQLEKSLRNMLVMTPKTLQTSGELYTHLRHSPFMAAWVAERATKDSAAWERQLDVMLSWEKEGCEPDPESDYEGGQVVGVSYLLEQGEHLKAKAEGVCSHIRCDLVRLVRDVLVETLKLPPKEAEQLAPKLAGTINVFYSFPLLGMALHQSPEKLAACGVQPEALDPEVLQRLREATHVDKFAAVMLQPEAKATAQAVMALDAELARTQTEVMRMAEVFNKINNHRSSFKGIVLDKAKAPSKRELRGRWMDNQSNFRFTFRNIMVALRGELSQNAPAEMGSRAELAEAAVAKVMSRVAPALANEPPKRLLTMLQPTYAWEHPSLPISSYVQQAAMELWMVRFKQLEKWLVGPWLGRLIDRSVNSLMKPTCLELLRTIDEIKEELRQDPKGWESTVDLVFEQYGLEDEIRKAFRRTFMKSRDSPLQLYKKELEAGLDDLQSSLPLEELHTNLVRMCGAGKGPGTPNAAENAQRVVRVVLHKLFLKLAEDVDEAIIALLQEQFRELCGRLYENKMDSVTKSVSRAQSVFIPAFLQSVRYLLGLAGNSEETNSEVARLKSLIAEKRSDLAARLAPEKWLDVLCRELPQGSILDAAGRKQLLQSGVDLVCTRLAQQRQHWNLLMPKAMPQAEADIGPIAAPDANWDHAGAMASSEQMAAFHARLNQLGLQLLDCPGAANNCMLFAVLHQMLGVPLDNNAEEEVEVVRMQLAALLRALLDEEEAMLAASGAGLGVLGDDSWHLRIARLAGAEEEEAAVTLAARQHLAAVERGEQLNLLDLSLLQLLQGWHNMRVVVYSPAFDPAHDYRNVLIEAADPAAAREVRIANVWYAWERNVAGARAEGARGELNHFMVVRQAAAAAGGPVGSATPRPRRSRSATDAPDTANKRSKLGQ